jgi:cell division control protein CDC15
MDLDLVKFEVIGRGATSVVYKALNQKTGDIVAVKSLENGCETANDVSFEIDLLKKIQHPNVIQMFGSFEHSKKGLLLIMEYCEGGSLLDLITEVGSVNETEVTIFVGQVLHGLVYLHEQGVIHRDIKYADF